MSKIKIFILFLPLVTGLYIFAPSRAALAATVQSAGLSMFKASSPINDEVEKSINLILACRDKGSKIPSADDLAPMLEYMVSAKVNGDSSHPDKRDEGVGVFWRGGIDKPFAQTVHYFFNPKIAHELLSPSSIRIGRWLPDSDILKLDKPLWEQINLERETPLALRGSSYNEITPDDFSGTYYIYRQNELILLLRYKDIPMLLHVSWQNGRSEIGKKGTFLGRYDNWDFVFSRESGSTVRGISLFDTYMYGACAVFLFFPQDDGHTGYSMFKWLSAGGAGLNVVKRSHIISGADRNFSGVSEVIGGKDGVSAGELERITSESMSQDREALLDSLAAYAQELERRSKGDSVLKRSEFQRMLKDGGYAGRLSEDELRALYRLNSLKRKLGKEVLGE
jgi:hypothetical protein